MEDHSLTTTFTFPCTDRTAPAPHRTHPPAPSPSSGPSTGLSVLLASFLPGEPKLNTILRVRSHREGDIGEITTSLILLATQAQPQADSLFQAFTLCSCSQPFFYKAAFYPAHLLTVLLHRCSRRIWLKPKKMTSTVALRAMTEGDHIGQSQFALHKPTLPLLHHLIFFPVLRNGCHKDLHPRN